MGAYVIDIQGFYDNMGMNIDEDIQTWENFKIILKGIFLYE